MLCDEAKQTNQLKSAKKEVFNMKEFWDTIPIIFAAIGGRLGYVLGGCDGLLIALVLFAISRA